MQMYKYISITIVHCYYLSHLPHEVRELFLLLGRRLRGIVLQPLRHQTTSQPHYYAVCS